MGVWRAVVFVVPGREAQDRVKEAIIMATIITNNQVLRLTDPRTTGSLFTLMASRTVNAHRYGGTMTYSALWRRDAISLAQTGALYRTV
jgi:hypothetical protein